MTRAHMRNDGLIECETCGAFLECDEYGDMPERCVCGRQIDWSEFYPREGKSDA